MSSYDVNGNYIMKKTNPPKFKYGPSLLSTPKSKTTQPKLNLSKQIRPIISSKMKCPKGMENWCRMNKGYNPKRTCKSCNQ